ncbi:MAG: methyltransferase domain-containing protein [Gammaproteobacteria bacterium]|nr:methyltransferase domain-containing protein [Gammaproteobacteria bacterium]
MASGEMTKTLDAYFNLMTSNGCAYIFQMASGMGLFNHITAAGISPAQLAQQTALQEKPCRLLLDGLAAIGLLTAQDKTFYPTALLKLLSGPYQQLGQEYWNHLPVFMHTGQPFKKMDDTASSEKEYIQQVESLDWMMQPSSMLATQVLKIGTEKNHLRILDLGAGSGVWSLAMLTADPTSNATLVDWPLIIDYVKTKTARADVHHRLEFKPGNYHQIDFGSEKFDLILMGNITHLETTSNLTSLLEKSRKSLAPSGQLLIFDVFKAQEKGKLAACLYAIGLALRTEGGYLYTENELLALCHQSGFSKTTFTPLEITPYTMGMISAHH